MMTFLVLEHDRITKKAIFNKNLWSPGQGLILLKTKVQIKLEREYSFRFMTIIIQIRIRFDTVESLNWNQICYS